MQDGDQSDGLAEAVRDASERRQALRPHGFDSKRFLGHVGEHQTLDLRPHRGIVRYEPTELVITVRGGTPLSEVEQALAERGQILAFEPPHFDGAGSIGGAVASGLGGPRRPWGGAPRDLLLGVVLLDGRGRVLRFGGEVMKNVAGYDVSRLMAGALGTLGILLELSVKVLPAPAVERTLVLSLPYADALKRMRELARQPAPLSGACHWDDRLYLRLSGNRSAVDAWQKKIGGDAGQGLGFWQELRDHRLGFFDDHRPLWRLSLAPATPKLACERQVLTDWGGAQRWVFSDTPAETLRQEVEKSGGHAILFRNGDKNIPAFHPLDPVRERLHQGLKRTFDPHGILNPGRQYATL